ncbi:hypothetical protein GCM10009827_114900 [Dactylosporangium maewongense]|uniref:Uncharacterized protein n=1 Tax=Dactylosporangium maewongense TaxID=634393 RepID=A0ABP4P579_9ACTN
MTPKRPWPEQAIGGAGRRRAAWATATVDPPGNPFVNARGANAELALDITKERHRRRRNE